MPRYVHYCSGDSYCLFNVATQNVQFHGPASAEFLSPLFENCTYVLYFMYPPFVFFWHSEKHLIFMWLSEMVVFGLFFHQIVEMQIMYFWASEFHMNFRLLVLLEFAFHRFSESLFCVSPCSYLLLEGDAAGVFAPILTRAASAFVVKISAWPHDYKMLRIIVIVFSTNTF